MTSKQTGWEIYRQQMNLLGHGDALWEPAPIYSYDRVKLGDVGYIHYGCFNLLFSAGCPLGERRLGVDVPPTFEPLEIGPTIQRQPRRPGCLRTSSVRVTGADLDISISATPILEPGAQFSLELTQERGAALVTKFPTYREDIQHRSVFEEYTKKHYDSWVKFSSKHGSDVKPVIIAGVDMTRDFAMIAYANNNAKLSSEFTISVPLAASASASVWGTWHTDGLVHTNCGPQVCTPPQSSDTSVLLPAGAARADTIQREYNQCVFIRYYTVRKRALMFPRVIKGAAGPHDLGPGNNRGETFPELIVQSNLNPGAASDGSDGSLTGSPSSASDHGSLLEVVHSIPSEEDPCDTVADYIFQNSEAETALIYFHDIALVQGGTLRSESVPECPPSVVVDGDGVGVLVHQTNRHLEVNPPRITHPVASEQVPQQSERIPLSPISSGPTERPQPATFQQSQDLTPRFIYQPPTTSINNKNKGIALISGGNDATAVPNAVNKVPEKDSLADGPEFHGFQPIQRRVGSMHPVRQRPRSRGTRPKRDFSNNVLPVFHCLLPLDPKSDEFTYLFRWLLTSNDERKTILELSEEDAKVFIEITDGAFRAQRLENELLNIAFGVLRSLCGRTVLHCLLPLDPESDEFTYLFRWLLTSNDERKTILELSEEDAKVFIEITDGAFRARRLENELLNIALGVLRRLCGRIGHLPKSYLLPHEFDLSGISCASGHCADVRKCVFEGKNVAVKTLKVSEMDDKQKIRKHFCKEVATWKNLSHPNVLYLIGAPDTLEEGRFSLVSEWMVNGNITEYVRKNAGNHLKLIVDAVEGLKYLHGANIVHGDLKGANILITNTKPPSACLADFGFMTIVHDPKLEMKSPETAAQSGWADPFMAPELLFPSKFGMDRCTPTKEADIYAMAMVIYQVLTGTLPFGKHPGWEVVFKVLAGTRPNKPENAPQLGLSDEVWELLEDCWQAECRVCGTLPSVRGAAQWQEDHDSDLNYDQLLVEMPLDAEDVGGCAMERQVSEGSVTSTDDSLFSKLSGAAGAGGLITDPGESTKVLTRSGHSKGDSVETLPAFLFSQSSDHAFDFQVSADPVSRPSTPGLRHFRDNPSPCWNKLPAESSGSSQTLTLPHHHQEQSRSDTGDRPSSLYVELPLPGLDAAPVTPAAVPPHVERLSVGDPAAIAMAQTKDDPSLQLSKHASMLSLSSSTSELVEADVSAQLDDNPKRKLRQSRFTFGKG